MTGPIRRIPRLFWKFSGIMGLKPLLSSEQVEKYPDLLEKICEEGHAVSNHTITMSIKIYANDEAFESQEK